MGDFQRDPLMEVRARPDVATLNALRQGGPGKYTTQAEVEAIESVLRELERLAALQVRVDFVGLVDPIDDEQPLATLTIRRPPPAPRARCTVDFNGARLFEGWADPGFVPVYRSLR